MKKIILAALAATSLVVGVNADSIIGTISASMTWPDGSTIAGNVTVSGGSASSPIVITVAGTTTMSDGAGIEIADGTWLKIVGQGDGSKISVVGTSSNAIKYKNAAGNFGLTLENLAFEGAGVESATSDSGKELMYFWAHNAARPVIDFNNVVVKGMRGRTYLVANYACVVNFNSGTVFRDNEKVTIVYYGTIYGSSSDVVPELNIHDGCVITKNDARCFILSNSCQGYSDINMYGGEVSENTIYETAYGSLTTVINNLGTFNLYGGAIKDNHNDGVPSGVAVYGTVLNYGTMNIYGGEISGNHATAGGAVFNGLGYLSAGKRSTVNVFGGTISGNHSDGASGGAIYTNTRADCNLFGGTISGNVSAGQGGAIYAADTLNIVPQATNYVVNGVGRTTDGTLAITGNTAATTGGGISANSTAVTLGGSCVAITNNTSTAGKGPDLAVIAGKPVAVANTLADSTVNFTLLSATGAVGVFTNGTAFVLAEGASMAGIVIRQDGYRVDASGVVSEASGGYAAWAAANGVTGAWDATDANGVANVFRYAFNRPTGDAAILGIEFNEAGKAVIVTAPLVNATGFTFTVVASDDLDGEDAVATTPLSASGRTVIDEAKCAKRFFRLRAVEE